MSLDSNAGVVTEWRPQTPIWDVQARIDGTIAIRTLSAQQTQAQVFQALLSRSDAFPDSEVEGPVVDPNLDSNPLDSKFFDFDEFDCETVSPGVVETVVDSMLNVGSSVVEMFFSTK